MLCTALWLRQRLWGTAPVFARCGVAAPAFPDRLGAMDLFEAFQGAAQAVQQLDEATRAHAHSAEMQGMFSRSCLFGLYSSALPSFTAGIWPKMTMAAGVGTMVLARC